MEAVIAAEAEDLAAPLHETQTLPAGLAEQNMAQGKAASPWEYMHLKQSAQTLSIAGTPTCLTNCNACFAPYHAHQPYDVVYQTSSLQENAPPQMTASGLLSNL